MWRFSPKIVNFLRKNRNIPNFLQIFIQKTLLFEKIFFTLLCFFLLLRKLLM